MGFDVVEAELGSVETGKRADLILVDRGRLDSSPDADPWSTVVFAASPAAVRLTMIDGDILAEGGHLHQLDRDEILAEAAAAASQVARTAGLAW